MTIDTTTQAEEPEWMRVRRKLGGGYLQPVDHDNVHDVDYLMARLRKILDTNERIGSLRYLPADIEELIEELRPHGREGDAVYERLRATYPKLFWGRYGGTIIGLARSDGKADSTAAERCAAELRLTSTSPLAERPVWQGTDANLPVRVVGAPIVGAEAAPC
ncbi:hypothetical protein [Nocardia xishanensis]